MRYLSAVIVFSCVFIAACKKDKYTTEPQISFRSIKPDVLDRGITNGTDPVLTIRITDEEGDVGLNPGKDTARIYIKNLITNETDSLDFPNLSIAATKKFQADVDITILSNVLLEGSTRPAPKIDTLYYEIYIRDFAKNKSNVIKTSKPLYEIFP